MKLIHQEYGCAEFPNRHVNLNGGVAAKRPASFPKHGKTGGLLAIGPRLYAWLNMENGKWPDVDQALIWSDDNAATWHRSEWLFARGRGNLKPATFANFGPGSSGMPAEVAGLAAGEPRWSPDVEAAQPVFTDANGTGDLTSVVYAPALRRYLLTNFHKGPGQSGVFDGPQPWGMWTTVDYEEVWGGMNAEGAGLTCSFPQKWMSADGRTLWCIFSVYGDGAKTGLAAHDKFNLVKATLRLRSDADR